MDDRLAGVVTYGFAHEDTVTLLEFAGIDHALVIVDTFSVLTVNVVVEGALDEEFDVRAEYALEVVELLKQWLRFLLIEDFTVGAYEPDYDY